jgi:hypothetical protein
VTDSLAVLRFDEQWAAEAVARATGASAHAYDLPGRQGAVDVTLAYSDGREGALEVTSHAGQGVQQRDAVLARDEHRWPNPGTWAWFIRVGTATVIPEMRRRYRNIIAICEHAGVSSPERLPWEVRLGDPDLAWLLNTPDASIRGTPPRGHLTEPGPVWVLPGVIGAFVDEQLAALPAAVEELLQVDHIARHLPKLLAHTADEHHLFVILKGGAVPESLYMVLARGVEALPPTVPALPEGLSHLWLSTGYGPSLLCCTPTGWSDHRVFGTST